MTAPDITRALEATGYRVLDRGPLQVIGQRTGPALWIYPTPKGCWVHPANATAPAVRCKSRDELEYWLVHRKERAA